MSAFWERLDAEFAEEIAAGKAAVSQEIGMKLSGGDTPLWIPDTIEEYHGVHAELESYRKASESKWAEWTRAYCMACPYYLARFILSTKNPDWIIRDKQALDHQFALRFLNWLQFCERETLFLIAREHLKSTLSSFVRVLHIILCNPNETQAIISDTLKLSTSFCRKSKREMEQNADLYALFPDIFWANPKKESDQWSLGESNTGLTVKRTVNVAEATLTPIGLDSAIPTGPHYGIRRYDDIVTVRNTQNAQAMAKTKKNLKASASLGRDGGYGTFVGTTYHRLDAYHDLQKPDDDGNIVVKRVIKVPCYEDIEEKTGPTYYSLEYLQKKETESKSDFPVQWLLNPTSGRVDRFDLEWIRYYDPLETFRDAGGERTMAQEYARCGLLYMTVDGAGGEKQNTTDFTVMQMWATQPDESVVLLDAVRDQLNPSDRIAAAMALHQKWGEYRFQNCRWEQYAMDSDVWWLEQEQTRTSNYFEVIVVAGYSKSAGISAKTDRITGRLFPVFKNRRIIIPDQLLIECKYLGGGTLDYTQVFRAQARDWPNVEFDDDLDCGSRLFEPNHPLSYPDREMKPVFKDRYQRALERRYSGGESNWVA